MNRSLFLDDTSLRILCAGLLALGNHVQPLHDGTLFRNKDLKHLTSFAIVFATVHINRVAFLYMQFTHKNFLNLWCRFFCHCRCSFSLMMRRPPRSTLFPYTTLIFTF